MQKKGISLIVLVITIIVMIILAASVVISLSNTGIISKANQAVQLTDEKQVQDLASLIWAEAYLDKDRADTIESVVKDKLREQGITESDWNINVTDKGVTVNKKGNANNTSSVPGLYKTGSNYTELLYSWDDLIANGVIHVDGEIYSSNDKNEYGFYYGVQYTTSIEDASVGPNPQDDYILGLLFKEDGSVEGYENGILVGQLPAGSAIYSANSIDLTAMELGVGIISDDGTGIAFVDAGFGFSCTPTIRTNVNFNDGTNSSSEVLKGDLLIPEGVSIGQYGFAACTNLTGVKIPEGIVNISQGAFGACESLTSITIPSTVTRIHTDAFTFCTNLSNINFAENGYLTVIGQTSFYQCTSLKNITIPSTVKYTEQRAFGWCTGLESVTILDGFATVGYAGFEECTSLKSVYIPLSVTKFSSHAFTGCENLTDVYYAGSENDWGEIFGSGSNAYSSPARYGATIHYNYTGK